MQAEYEHSILNVFQVMITNSRVDTRVDVSEQTNGQTNVRKLAHLYGAAEADATKTRKCLWTYWRTHVLTYSRTDAGLSPCEISSTYSRAKNAEKVIKNTFRIMKTPHAYLQTILKASVKFQKDWPKTVGGVEGTRYLLPIHFCSIRAQKMSKLKMRKKW